MVPASSVVDPGPDPHQIERYDTIRIHINVIIWIRIRIRIKVLNWIRIRINLQITSRKVWKMSLFEHFFKVLRV